jgi:glycosyltransferase involved in cell wall biosynthesis
MHGSMTGDKRSNSKCEDTITVIVPVHNGEKTISRCLNSITHQSIEDFEVVVVDNASNDSTKDMILSSSRKDPRIRYVFEDRKGRGEARQRGIKSSKGTILAWTDADCEVPYLWLEKITGPIVQGKEMVVQGNEEQLSGGYWSDEAQIAGQRHFEAYIEEPPYIDHLDTKNFAIRKDLLLSVGGFDSRLKALEDFELKVRLKKNGNKILYLRDLSVKHHHREKFRDLFRNRYEQGFWAAVIFYLHMDFFRSEESPDNTIKSMYKIDTILFPLHLGLFLLRNGPRKLLFEAVTGYIWRLGNMKGRFRYKKILKFRKDR